MNKKTIWTIPQEWENLYINSVKNSITSNDYFNTFRQNEYYNLIVPNNVPRPEAQLLFDVIIQHSDIMEKFSTIKLMDNIGSPVLYEPWNTCPRNFKYMYSSLRIKENFGTNIKNIVEIGVGYGGLCFTLGQYFNLIGYKLVDVECVIELAKLFLSKLPSLSNDLQFFDSKPPYDLGISECAITELDDKSIEYYYYKYLLQCKFLFIRTNFQNIGRLNWFTDMIKEDFDIKMEPDLPNEQEQTVILGWKNENS